MRKIKTLTLFKAIQRYYCLVIYAFMLCLYGVITISAFLCGSGDMAIACDFVLPLLLIASCVVTAVCAYVVCTNTIQITCAQNTPRKCGIACMLLSMITMSVFVSGGYLLWLRVIELMCGSSAGSVEYELLEQRSQIFDIFFSGSRLGSFVSAMMFFAIIFLSALLLSVVIKRFNRSVAILTAAAYTALFIKLFSELYAGNFAESIVYRRTLGLLAVAELAVFFAVACRRMDVKR